MYFCTCKASKLSVKTWQTAYKACKKGWQKEWTRGAEMRGVTLWGGVTLLGGVTLWEGSSPPSLGGVLEVLFVKTHKSWPCDGAFIEPS